MKKLTTFFLTFIGVVTVSLAHDHAASPLQTALEQYVKIQTALAGDSLKGVPEAAAAIAATAKEHADALPATTAAQAEAVGKATDIKAARVAFKPLSATLIAAASAAKEKTGHYYEAFCPMAGAAWIQSDKNIANPYYGASMLTCGEIRKEL
jgi:predicted DsbA family dithiol-disulfide isomerase